jgi:hypothetical protein
MRTKAWRGRLRVAAGALLLLLAATAATAQDEQGSRFFRKGTFDGSPDGMTEAQFKAAFPEWFPVDSLGVARPSDIPDVYGPGAVLSVGSILMKVTNWGVFGNPFQNVSSDPSGQWPGASGVEYLNFAGIAVGAVNPEATDPNAIRRVSSNTEWRPPSLASVDKMYRAYDGIVNGARFKNDDNDHYEQNEGLYLAGAERFDEDFLDGVDEDLDGSIDEDFAALGQQTITCRMNDYTLQSINATAAEKHVPLGVEIQQMAWAYSIPGYTEFNVVEYNLINKSGHVLDSLVVGGWVDMDCGPVTASSYWADDQDLAGFPSCELPHQTENPRDLRYQGPSMRTSGVPSGIPDDSALCSNFKIRINGFSVADDNGDLNLTKGIPSFLLVNHTVDPLGVSGPKRVGFLAFRSFTGSTPYVGGGRPRTDQQAFEFLSGAAGTNIGTLDRDGPLKDGFIIQERGDEKGDYQAWWSCGPWLLVPAGGSIQVTVAFTIGLGDKELAYEFANDYQRAAADSFLPDGGLSLISKYPSLANAVAAQVAYEGVYAEAPPGWTLYTNGHGRETPVHPNAGEGAITTSDCHEGSERTVNYTDPVDWFDYDCDYCTGAFDGSGKGVRTFHNTWSAEAPPPNPNLNVTALYNYYGNQSRVVAAGDNQVTLAWDNVSETTPDPKSGWLDFRGYRVWKAANWQRPVGSAGPSDADWSLLGEFRQFHQWVRGTDLVWRLRPQISFRKFVPSYSYPVGSTHCPNGCVDSATVDVTLNVDDLWNPQSGEVVRALAVGCMQDTVTGGCAEAFACINGKDRLLECPDSTNWEHRIRYPVGRYQLVDREVKNGFVYFYSVTAFDWAPAELGTAIDSTTTAAGLEGRRSATEADGVVPQTSVRTGKNAWVVPNPYRGYRNIADRPSSWDLTPNGTDPTGTHIDFLGLPRGKWVIKIFTVSGDLVQTLRSEDAVNESVRTSIPGPGGTLVPGYNRQQDNPNDGQARWNLISRNGQDVVSGIYLFTVDSGGGVQRGKFVVIR